MPTRLLALIAVLILTACGGVSDTDRATAQEVATVLNAWGASFTTVTAESGGSVAIETNLYPKDSNQAEAEPLCGLIASAQRAGELPNLKHARVRAADGTTLHHCVLP